jgi:hypothetical protein
MPNKRLGMAAHAISIEPTFLDCVVANHDSFVVATTNFMIGPQASIRGDRRKVVDVRNVVDQPLGSFGHASAFLKIVLSIPDFLPNSSRILR